MGTLDGDDLTAQSGRGKLPRSAVLTSYLIAAAVMGTICLLTRSEALTDWDSWEYAALAVARQPSGLCLGRWWFIFFMRLAYLAGSACGVDLMHSYVPLQLAVAVMSTAAVVAVMHWTYLFTGRLSVAILAGVIGMASPSLVVYCSAVMTEGPTMLFLALAMIGWERALARSGARPRAATLWSAAAGMAFGIAASMREPAVLFCAWPAISCFIDRPEGRWRLLAAGAAGAAGALGFGVCMGWAWSGVDPVTTMRNYCEYMRTERATFGFHPRDNVVFLATHIVIAAPLGALALLAHFLRWGLFGSSSRTDRDRKPVSRRLMWLGVAMGPYVLMTWYNPNLSFNYRLMLPLAWMVLPIAAGCAEMTFAWLREKLHLAALTGTIVAGVVVLLLAVVTMKVTFTRMLIPVSYYTDYQREMFEQMQMLPGNAAVFPGPGSAIGIYLHRTGLRPDWIVVPTGFGWTRDNLTQRVEEFFRKGKRVFVNLEPYGWRREGCVPTEWLAITDMASQYEIRYAVGGFMELLPRSGRDPQADEPPATTAPSTRGVQLDNAGPGIRRDRGDSHRPKTLRSSASEVSPARAFSTAASSSDLPPA